MTVLYFVSSGDRLSSPAGWIFPAVTAALALMVSPIVSSRTYSHAQATESIDRSEAGAQPVVVYHRPGCTFCARLKLVLTGVRSRALWVDIWADPEAAAFVRSVNDGNETVPTVLIDGRPHTNPDPFTVRRALTA